MRRIRIELLLDVDSDSEAEKFVNTECERLQTGKSTTLKDWYVEGISE